MLSIPMQMMLVAVAGWVNREQLAIIELSLARTPAEQPSRVFGAMARAICSLASMGSVPYHVTPERGASPRIADESSMPAMVPVRFVELSADSVSDPDLAYQVRPC